MDFLSRKRPCLLIEEQPTLENTKKLLINKLNFLKKQYKFCFETLWRNENISSEFVQNTLFSFDFYSKVLDSINYLASSSELAWNFLKSFILNANFPYILGNFKKNVSILNTDLIVKDSDFFFFNFLTLRLIDFKTWKNLCQLKHCSENFGLSGINDFAYYMCKKENLIEVPSEMKVFLNELEKDYEDFDKFLGRPVEFKALNPIMWRFLKITEELKNMDDVFIFFKRNKYKYDLMRKDNKLNGFSQDQKMCLFNGLSEIRGFEDLYFLTFEFKLFEDEKIKDFFGYVLVFFLSQNNFSLDGEEFLNSKKDFEHKFINSIWWMELILFLSKNKINLLRHFNKSLDKSFRTACDLEMAVLKDERVLKKIGIVNFSALKIAMNLWKELEQDTFYKKYYSKYLNNYFELLVKFN